MRVYAPVVSSAITLLRDHARFGTAQFYAEVLKRSEDESVLGALLAKRLVAAPMESQKDALHVAE